MEVLGDGCADDEVDDVGIDLDATQGHRMDLGLVPVHETVHSVMTQMHHCSHSIENVFLLTFC